MYHNWDQAILLLRQNAQHVGITDVMPASLRVKLSQNAHHTRPKEKDIFNKTGMLTSAFFQHFRQKSHQK